MDAQRCPAQGAFGLGSFQGPCPYRHRRCVACMPVQYCTAPMISILSLLGIVLEAGTSVALPVRWRQKFQSVSPTFPDPPEVQVAHLRMVGPEGVV